MSLVSNAPVFREAERSAALILARDYLSACGIDQAAIDARLLLLAACACQSSDLLRAPDERLSADAAERLTKFLERRARHEPVTRILGRRAFWTLDLKVKADVLDPRGDSESLIRLALRVCASGTLRKILDLGCGSGALLCAILAEYPDAFGFGVDLSLAACRLSQENIDAHALGGRAAVIQGVWGESLAGRFDLIVSNPPYIATTELSRLPPEVLHFDPLLALDGGADGLESYRMIFLNARNLLSSEGVLVLELGAGQRTDVTKIAGDLGFVFSGVEADFGGHERAIAFSRGSARSSAMAGA